MERLADALKTVMPLQASGRIVPAALIGGLALALAGGFYVWRAPSAPQTAQGKNTAAIPVAPLPPAIVATREEPVVRELPPVHDKAHDKERPAIMDAACGTRSQQVSPAADEAAASSVPAIRIGRGQQEKVVDPLLLAAWQAYRAGDFDTAMQRYEEVLRNDERRGNPPSRDALLGMAAIARQRSQDAVAARYYGQVLDLDPDDPDARAALSSPAGPDGLSGDESRLKLLLAQRPDAAVLHFALGNYYAGQSRWAEAQRAYAGAGSLGSGNALFAFNLAVSLDHLGQRDLAAWHYRRALQLDEAGSAGFDHVHTQLRLDALESR